MDLAGRMLGSVAAGRVKASFAVEQFYLIGARSLPIIGVAALAIGMVLALQVAAALARALILEPRLILYDEPTANLDPPTVLEITRLINRLKEVKGITSLVATHDMATAQKIADRVAMISGGERLFEGTYDEAHADPSIRRFMEGF
jgi:ABC-type transporter Mla maintaining outer membrane lipid asymmetry ATPase subunit MlaF